MFYIEMTTSTISEIAKRFKITDNRTAKKWLNDLNVKIYSIGGKDQVLNWELELMLHSQVVENLKQKFPSNWHKIYEEGHKDRDMIDAIFVIHPPEENRTVKATNHKKFLK